MFEYFYLLINWVFIFITFWQIMKKSFCLKMKWIILFSINRFCYSSTLLQNNSILKKNDMLIICHLSLYNIKWFFGKNFLGICDRKKFACHMFACICKHNRKRKWMIFGNKFINLNNLRSFSESYIHRNQVLNIINWSV